MTQQYIMQHAEEPQRIRRKTSALLIRHHLDWIGMRSGESLVDLGCATGEVVREAAALSPGGRIVGIDADPMMLAAARSASPSQEYPNVEFVEARIGEVGSVPLADGEFHHAWARFFLEYQSDVDSIVREMARVVKPGGKVNLLDLSENCVWHFPLTPALRVRMDEVVDDLRATGFDPHVGARLREHARRAGLVDVREQVEPYHRILGRPDAETSEQWRRKLYGLKLNYSTKLFPAKTRLHDFFDEMLEYIESPDTMTWSNLHLVQGTKP